MKTISTFNEYLIKKDSLKLKKKTTQPIEIVNVNQVEPKKK